MNPRSPCDVIEFSGAGLPDLEQKTLPGVAQQVVEQMGISDQVGAGERANVLRALLLSHRFLSVVCPSRETHLFIEFCID